MICKVKKTIEKYSMLKSGQTVAVGVSGGADSVCLLHVLSKIRDEYGIVVKVVHVNHNIRGQEAKRDENFVQNLCNRLGVEFILFSRDIPLLSKQYGLSEEECGRKVRYDCFSSVGADVIATAHTLSDSAETIIFNIARGTGLKGLTGIAPVRGNVIRPLIELSRQDVEQYCKENRLDFVTDSTNMSDDYTRNKIRHNVIPILKQINPEFETSVKRLEDSVHDDEIFLEISTNQLLERCKVNGGWDLQKFSVENTALKKRALRVILSDNMNKEPESKHVELCLKAMENKSSVEIAKDLYICFDGDIISLRKKSLTESQPWSIKFKQGSVKLRDCTVSIDLLENSPMLPNNCYSLISADCLDLSKLIFRSRASGDKFTDIKRKNTKTLKKLFCEKRIPPSARNDIAILCFENKVVWVEGVGTSADYVVHKNTKKVIAINIIRQKTEDIKNV